MNTLDTVKYGYPLIESYAINTDLALVRSEFQSAWKRQRRSFLHNASLITLSWQLPQNLTNELISWLEALPTTDFFECELLTGNDAAAPQVISLTEIRRTSAINCRRIPFTTIFIMSFEAETKKQIGYEIYADAVADLPPLTYPDYLPMPLAEGYGGEHGARNITTYALTYQMNTETLAKWLEFAGFAGTAWFNHPMYSENVSCGLELIRYISPPNQSLIAPDKWAVSITAENMPAYALLSAVINPTAECTYDDDLTYDDPLETYDCGGIVPPPSGNFVMPAGVFTQAKTATGATTATATCQINLLADGSVVSNPVGSPSWVQWHTLPASLLNPAVKMDKVIEFSRDGVNWNYYTPTPSGVWLSLKTNLYIRLSLTNTFDKSISLDFTMTFNSDASVSPYAIDYQASCSMDCTVDLTAPVGGVTNGYSWDYAQSWTIDQDAVMPPNNAGLQLLTNGVTDDINAGIVESWFKPNSIGIGAQFWVEAVKTSGVSTLSGARQSLIAPVKYYISKRGGGVGTSSIVSWYGVLNFYNQASGGSPIASNELNIFQEYTKTGVPP